MQIRFQGVMHCCILPDFSFNKIKHHEKKILITYSFIFATARF